MRTQPACPGRAAGAAWSCSTRARSSRQHEGAASEPHARRTLRAHSERIHTRPHDTGRRPRGGACSQGRSCCSAPEGSSPGKRLPEHRFSPASLPPCGQTQHPEVCCRNPGPTGWQESEGEARASSRPWAVAGPWRPALRPHPGREAGGRLGRARVRGLQTGRAAPGASGTARPNPAFQKTRKCTFGISKGVRCVFLGKAVVV